LVAANILCAMNPRAIRAWALALSACVALAGGCGGSSTKTVSVASAPEQSSTTATSSATASARSSTTTTTGTTSTGAAATRTASAPAFARQGGSEASPQGSAAAAAAAVRAHGYTPNDTSQYHPAQTLRVLVGTRTGSGDGYAQQAFFFLGDRYIGTDTSQPSASIRVVSQSDTEVTLAYPLYRAHDPLCCPGGGSATVSFQLNNGRLTPLQAIPPASSQAGLSRQ
jgi:LppP/LprE lipoprotein